jgi:purine-binding chemotaxis protein CheW
MAEITAQSEQVNKEISKKGGKYLTFGLANAEYGLEILKVRQIIGYLEITPVPQTPEYAKGVINLRGQIIPVIDLRVRFGMEAIDVTAETCVIVVKAARNGQKFEAGIIVDRVQEVLDIAGKDIEPTPEFDSMVNTDFVFGMGKVGDSVKILLDIDRVLAGDDMEGLAGVSSNTGEE